MLSQESREIIESKKTQALEHIEYYTRLNMYEENEARSKENIKHIQGLKNRVAWYTYQLLDL